MVIQRKFQRIRRQTVSGVFPDKVEPTIFKNPQILLNSNIGKPAVLAMCFLLLKLLWVKPAKSLRTAHQSLQLGKSEMDERKQTLQSITNSLRDPVHSPNLDENGTLLLTPAYA